MTLVANYSEAVDNIFGLFNAAITDSSVAALVGYQPIVYWADQERAAKPDFSKFFVRITQQTVLEQQAVLGQCEGQRRFSTSGLVFVQLFCPKSAPDSARKARLLATICRNAFRGKQAPGSINFYRSRINELPPENESYRFNVVSEYDYDELG